MAGAVRRGCRVLAAGMERRGESDERPPITTFIDLLQQPRGSGRPDLAYSVGEVVRLGSADSHLSHDRQFAPYRHGEGGPPVRELTLAGLCLSAGPAAVVKLLRVL